MSHYSARSGIITITLYRSIPMSELNPQESDAVFGGQNLPPINAAVLGGEVGIKKRLQYEKSIARENKFWHNFKYLHGFSQYIVFEPHVKIINPQETAYFLRDYRYNPPPNNISFEDKFDALVKQTRASEVEGLFFGCLSNEKLINILVDNCKKLKKLKALCLGAISEDEQMISEIYHGDISRILLAYDKLEILQIRGRYLRFCTKLHHQNLKSLTIISGGLNRESLLDINELDLPALEYLEIWLGSKEYGSNSSITDLMPIISGDKFPKLKYLGFKNCEYTDDIAFELARSPIIEKLLELDLSMGALGDDALSAVLSCPMINELDKLDVSQNFISDGFIAEKLPQFKLNCELITEGQRQVYPYDDYGNEINEREYRYCVVAE
ncbi:hypothetical protein Cha6605_1066 [Chamaesiphon minutus PCC 6605]|uniref:Leucine Rich Repeat (LRR)-containing protein n=2 Tax=Chamaesiphon TaxID=217161 RepID=K9UDN2_CHAP6|nr:hypothetical protein Cha6605_1066 [Chamaesiphon minutus PCC 6605]